MERTQPRVAYIEPDRIPGAPYGPPAPASQRAAQRLSAQCPLTRAQLSRLRALLGAIEDGLKNGAKFRWSQGERELNMRLLSRAGAELMTKTGLAKAGLVLKRGQQPLGTAYYGAPLQLHAELYLVGVQTKAVQRASGLAAARGAHRTEASHAS